MKLPKIFIVTDSLSFLAPESIARLAASHFEGMEYKIERFPNVTTYERAMEIVKMAKEYNRSMIVLSSILVEVQDTFVLKCLELNIPYINVLATTIKTMGKLFNTPPVYEPSQPIQLGDAYYRRINAIEFAINNDDGKSLAALNKADVVLLGVSRTSKTPLSIYLAHMHLFVVNIPLVSEVSVPKHIFSIPSHKVIGLTISVERLNQIRSERNTTMGLVGDNSYSDMMRIIEELEFAEGIMKKIGCPVIDVTNKAVEETADEIIQILKT